MRQVTHLAFFVFTATLLVGCFDDVERDNQGLPQFIQVGEATKSFNNVDERLWIYFERFEEAGIERGMNVNLEADNVTGSIDTNPSQESAGACSFDSNGTLHHISIRQDFWDMANATEREVLIFHELGHCYLERGHLDLATPDGLCISLMRSGNDQCMDNYFENTREGYLDELFGL